MADWGIKVMRPGYDISTVPNSAENIKKFALLSSVNLLKIKQAAKVSINDSSSMTIAHGLAYKPLFWVFINKSGSLYPLYNEVNWTSAYINGTNLVIYNYEGGARDFYYYIFYDAI